MKSIIKRWLGTENRHTPYTGKKIIKGKEKQNKKAILTPTSEPYPVVIDVDFCIQNEMYDVLLAAESIKMLPREGKGFIEDQETNKFMLIKAILLNQSIDLKIFEKMEGYIKTTCGGKTIKESIPILNKIHEFLTKNGFELNTRDPVIKFENVLSKEFTFTLGRSFLGEGSGNINSGHYMYLLYSHYITDRAIVGEDISSKKKLMGQKYILFPKDIMYGIEFFDKRKSVSVMFSNEIPKEKRGGGRADELFKDIDTYKDMLYVTVSCKIE